jgi:hypothetical protein
MIPPAWTSEAWHKPPQQLDPGLRVQRVRTSDFQAHVEMAFQTYLRTGSKLHTSTLNGLRVSNFEFTGEIAAAVFG